MKSKKLLSFLLSLVMIIGTMGALATTASAAYSVSFTVYTPNSASLTSAKLYYTYSPNIQYVIGSANSSYTAVSTSYNGRTGNASLPDGTHYIVLVATDSNGLTYLYGYNGTMTDLPNGKTSAEETSTARAISVTSNHLCYGRTVIFNANGGSVSPAYSTVYYGAKYGTVSSLPTPTRAGYVFNGWYTSQTGGTQVTNTTAVPNTTISLYAQWGVDEQQQFEDYKKVVLNNVNNLMLTPGNSSAVKDLIFDRYYSIRDTINYPGSFAVGKILLDNAYDKLVSDIAAMKNIEAFNSYKQEKLAELESMLSEENVSDAAAALINEAIADITAMEYNSEQSLEANKGLVTARYNKLLSDKAEEEKPKVVFTESIADAGYTAESPEAEDKKGAIAVTVGMSGLQNFEIHDILSYGFFYWKTAEGEMGTNKIEGTAALSAEKPQFYTVVYDIDKSNADENIVVMPYITLNDGETALFGSPIVHKLGDFEITDKWLGTVDTMLNNVGLK